MKTSALMFGLTALTLISGCATDSSKANGGAEVSPVVVLPPDSTVGGRSMEQLSVAWWQWAMSSPDRSNPVKDTSGVNCDVGQRGAVWFLAGGFGSSKIKRTCTVPAGSYVFFPIINTAYWPRRENNGYTCDQARASAAVNNESALDLFAEIDGASLENPKLHRVKTTECFDIFERVPRELGPYRAYPSASDGFWILLSPMPSGRHTIKFGGRYNVEGHPNGRMVQDVEYEILIGDTAN